MTRPLLPDTIAMCLIDNDLRDFLGSGASLLLATAGSSGVPELAMALGCRVLEPGGRLAVFLDQGEAAPLRAQLQAGAQHVALVASRPTDLRTVQIKGVEPVLQPLGTDDLARLRATLGLLHRAFSEIDFGDPYASTLLHYQPEHLMAVSFRVSEVFEQTPGPQAGQPRVAAA